MIRTRWYSKGGTPTSTLADRRMRIHGASNKLILVDLVCLIPSVFVSVKMTIPTGGNVCSCRHELTVACPIPEVRDTCLTTAAHTNKDGQSTLRL